MIIRTSVPPKKVENKPIVNDEVKLLDNEIIQKPKKKKNIPAPVIEEPVIEVVEEKVEDEQEIKQEETSETKEERDLYTAIYNHLLKKKHAEVIKNVKY